MIKIFNIILLLLCLFCFLNFNSSFLNQQNINIEKFKQSTVPISTKTITKTEFSCSENKDNKIYLIKKANKNDDYVILNNNYNYYIGDTIKISSSYYKIINIKTNDNTQTDITTQKLLIRI